MRKIETTRINIEASRGAGARACSCKPDRLWVRFSMKKMKYLIFLFLRSGVGAKRGIKKTMNIL